MQPPEVHGVLHRESDVASARGGCRNFASRGQQTESGIDLFRTGGDHRLRRLITAKDAQRIHDHAEPVGNLVE
jgi:hypothetical protein